MINLGSILVLAVCWLFSTMLKVNDKTDSGAAFFWKSVFFFVAIGVAISFGMNYCKC